MARPCRLSQDPPVARTGSSDLEILNRLNQVASTGLVQLNERVAAGGELNPVKAQ